MVIVLFFTSTSFPAKTPTHILEVLAVQEFWMELGLGESSSVQLSPQTPRAAQPFSAAPCFWRHCLRSQPTVPLGAPETSLFPGIFLHRLLPDLELCLQNERWFFLGPFQAAFACFLLLEQCCLQCPERGSGSGFADCGCSGPFQV